MITYHRPGMHNPRARPPNVLYLALGADYKIQETSPE